MVNLLARFAHHNTTKERRALKQWGVGLTVLLAATNVMAKDIQLLNGSYDPTRELDEQYTKAFSAHWKQQTGDNVVIRQSHGGSANKRRR